MAASAKDSTSQSYECFGSNEWIGLEKQTPGELQIPVVKLTNHLHVSDAKKVITNRLKFDTSCKTGRSEGSFKIVIIYDSAVSLAQPNSERLTKLIEDDHLAWCGVTAENTKIATDGRIVHSKKTSTLGETKEYSIIPVNHETPLICKGYFSWWGIEVTTDIAIKDKHRVQYLADPYASCSRYGSVKFTIDAQDVFQSYKNHFRPGAALLFKRAGTLAYKHETCYVILVCAQEEGKDDPLPQFTTLPADQFLDSAQPHMLNISSPCSVVDGASVRWNHFSFAFHFPEESQFAVSSKSVDLSLVQHKIYRRAGAGRPVPVPWCLHSYKCPDYQLSKRDFNEEKESLSQQLQQVIEEGN